MLKSNLRQDQHVPPYAIAIIAFIIAAASSMAYYQYFYVPALSQNQVSAYAESPDNTIVTIVVGASLENNEEFMVP